MDDYKLEQRKKKRGGHCVFGFIDPVTKVGRSCLCGCGTRKPVGKKHKARIVKRSIKRMDLKEFAAVV